MYKLPCSDKNQRGSGLVGLLVVIFIIGIVLWYMTASFNGIDSPSSPGGVQEDLEKGRQAGQQQDLRRLREAIQLYRTERGTNPDSLQVLVAEDYIPASTLTDSEGETYNYDPQTGEVEAP